jgi:3-oxoadipate enol-lactonase
MNIQHIKRDFGSLTFFQSGSGPVLLGLSGFGSSHYNYIDLVSQLQKHFTVVLIDNRGMGKSDKTKNDYSIKNLAEDALAVMDFIGAKTFGLMGISMGGFIAQELALIAKDRVSAMSLMCTTSGPPHFNHPTKLTEEGLRQFNSFDPLVQAQYATMGTVHPTLAEKNPSQFQRIINLRVEHKADIEELVRQNNAACDFIDKETDLSNLAMPVLAFAGKEDRFVSPDSPNVFKSMMTSAKVETDWVAEADHFFFLEKPELVSERLVSFFKGKLV